MLSNSLILYSFIHFGFAVLMYRWVISNHPNLQAQRIYLLILSISGALIPFISWNSMGVVSQISEIVVNTGNELVTPFVKQNYVHHFDILGTIYWSGVLLIGIKIVIQYVNAFRLVTRFPIESKDGICSIRKTNENLPSFSFWNQICLHDSDSDSIQIIEHEKVHVREFHSLDRLAMDILKIVFWFNPFVYKLAKQVELTHELIADKHVITKTEQPELYAQLIVNSVCGFPKMIPVQTFAAKKNIQTRIQYILNKNLKLNTKRMKYVPVLTALFLSASIFMAACTEQNLGGFEENPDVKPQFGVESGKLIMNEIGKTLVYPESARIEQAEGRVILQFYVKKDGKLEEIEVLRSSGRADLDAAALTVAKNLDDDWEPATKNGIQVDAKFVMPIVFKLGKK